MKLTNSIKFKIFQQLSGNYFTQKIPEAFMFESKEVQNAWIEDHLCEMYQDFSPSKVFEELSVTYEMLIYAIEQGTIPLVEQLQKVTSNLNIFHDKVIHYISKLGGALNVEMTKISHERSDTSFVCADLANFYIIGSKESGKFFRIREDVNGLHREYDFRWTDPSNLEKLSGRVIINSGKSPVITGALLRLG